jgi:non-heme chloroperoxidase
MPTLTTGDGVRLHYTDSGRGDVMIFIPGWSMSGNWWAEQRSHFEKSHRVIVVDPRAQGESEPVVWGHRLSRHAADLRDTISALDLTGIVLIGWSRGSNVLLSYLELFGAERIRGIVLSGFTPSLATRSDWSWGFNKPPQDFIASVAAGYPDVVKAMIPEMTHQKLAPGTIARLTEESLRTPALAAARMLEDHMNIDWRDILPRIQLPVLICAGEKDAQAPPASADAAAALLPRATVVKFAESGHCPFIEEPQKFNRAIEDFLATLRPA